MKTLRILVLIAGLLLAVGLVQGQDGDTTCPVIVESALDVAGDVCGATGRNEICYGNVVLEAEPQEWADSLALDGPGDIEDVAAIRRVQLSSMDTVTSEWGIALMRLQANLPDTLPGQNVLFVLFGDVEIESAVVSNAEPLTEIVRVTGGVNLRQGPSTNTAVVGGLAAGDEIIADGISEDGQWLRVRWDDGHAWVFAELVTTAGDLAKLDMVQAEAPFWTPMQAFYLQTGLRDSSCNEAPDSGLLVQTPEGAETVTFRVNEVDIALGSTAYLQAGDELRVAVVEGQAEVTAFDVTREVPAGAQVFVPLDANGAAAGPPGLIEAYEAEDVAALPVPLLDEVIEVAAPASSRTLFTATHCSLSTTTSVNIRSRPNANALIVDNLQPGFSPTGTGRYIDANGEQWWRISSNRWVSASVVETTGPCDAVEVVEPPTPPTAAPQSGSVGGPGYWFQVQLDNFNPCSPSTVALGTSLRFNIGHGYSTEAEAEAARESDTTTITIDGVSVPVVRTPVQLHTNGLYSFWTQYEWYANRSGTFTVIGNSPHHGQIVCSLTVED